MKMPRDESAERLIKNWLGLVMLKHVRPGAIFEYPDNLKKKPTT